MDLIGLAILALFMWGAVTIACNSLFKKLTAQHDLLVSRIAELERRIRQLT